jgi:hypothetical protein
LQQAQSSQQWKKTRAEEDQEDGSSFSETNESPESTTIRQQHQIPPKTTSKILARRQYEKELREQDVNANNDEDVLEVFDQNVASTDVDDSSLDAKEKGKGKAEPTSMNLPGALPSKRRRPVMDPFAASGQYRLVSI